MLSLLPVVLFAGVHVAAHPPVGPSPGLKGSSGWDVKQFNSLVTFGDSYTDESYLSYLFTHNGTAPPIDMLLPESYSTASGGRTWDRYVIQYTGQTVNGQWDPQMTLYDYAVAGAVCSNLITPRYVAAIHQNFPSVLEDEIPRFVAQQSVNSAATGRPLVSPALTATNAVYAIWIGTNDVGNNAFLTDSQVPGKSLSDYMDCVYTSVDKLYAAGGRYFVLLNLAPLELSPLYGNASVGGLVASKFWTDKPSNRTAIAEKMREYTTTLNSLYRYETGYDALVANRWPGSNVAVFDVHSLMGNIYNNPMAYLNGTAPPNVTSFQNQCPPAGAPCTLQSSPDSFFWYDELHPSEQVDRIIAKEFVNVISGNSIYATYYKPNAFSGRW